MKKILFLHPGKANLPEIHEYKRYLSEYEFYNCREMNEYCLEDFDLIWKFMGIDIKKTQLPTIHEYASLSIGRYAKVKDFIKSKCNTVPSLRVFLNRTIAERYQFNDRVPACFRDMGISRHFFNMNGKKNYDFVYVGNMDKDRNLYKIVALFSKVLSNKTLLLIGSPSEDLYNTFKKYENITFTGVVPYEQVATLACQAEYAINYIPNKYPYNLQTSTKLLEYIAMGLKIITTEYQWVSQFEQARNMRFFKISEDISDFSMERLQRFSFVNGDVEDLCWENIIKNSGIEQALKTIL